MKTSLVIVAAASCFTATGRAASSPPTSGVPSRESLLACAKMQDVNERVRCYDALVAAMNSSQGALSGQSNSAARALPAPSVGPSSAAAPAAGNATGPVAAAPKAPGSASTPAATVPDKSAEARFGRELLPPASRPPEIPEETILLSKITALRTVGPKMYVISLANGQIWRQEGTTTTAFFRVGDDVRIKRGTLGSYRMWTAAVGEKNWVRVTRIQ